MKKSLRKWYRFIALMLIVISMCQYSFAQVDKSIETGIPSVESQAAFSSQAHIDIVSPVQTMNKAGTGSSTYSPNLLLPPPGNDNCAAGLNPPYVLSPGASCTNGSLRGSMPTPNATVEAGETFGCASPAPTRTVWYSFAATQADMWLSIKPTVSVCTILGFAYNFGITVFRYSGTCPPNSGSVVGCVNYQTYSAQYVYNILNLTGLVAGTTYMVQITQNSGCQLTTGSFCIALGVPSTCTTCSSPCGPMCVYTPTPPTPAQVTATCPGYPLAPPMNQFDIRTNCYTFTAPNDSVNLQQIVYAYCGPGNTYSFTYDLFNSVCGLIQSGNVFANNLLTGLTVGQTYRICYTLQAACSWDSLVYPYAYTTSSALPVEFVSFGAVPFNKKIKIYWSTASEENCMEYVLERTSNAVDFIEIARVKAAGNSTGLLNYRAFDDSPLEGSNFYRLKQIDFNGDYTYTKLVAVKFSSVSNDLSIVPNPAQSLAKINFNASGSFPAMLRISDMRGKLVINKQFLSQEGFNELGVNTNELNEGIYSVQLIVDDQILTSKLVKE